MMARPPADLPWSLPLAGGRPGRRRARRIFATICATILVAGCGGRPPRPSSPATVSPSASIEARPPGPGLDGFAVVHADGLMVSDAEGVARDVSGPGGPIERASIANGRVVVQTAGPLFHIALVGPDLTS